MTDTAFDTANQQVAAASTGLTIAKLREAKRRLMAREVDFANDPAYIAVTSRQIENLLATTEVTSSGAVRDHSAQAARTSLARSIGQMSQPAYASVMG